MRDLIIKLYFGQGAFKSPINGKWYFYPTAAKINMIHTILTSTLCMFFENVFFQSILVAIWFFTLTWFSFSLFGLSYWKSHPVYWIELTKKQKWYWGLYYSKRPFITKPSSLQANWHSWMILNEIYKREYDIK